MSKRFVHRIQIIAGFAIGYGCTMWILVMIHYIK
jgi:hypothetical protein